MNTPTPGDLSARHVEALNELRIGVEFDAHCDPLGVQKLEALDAALAALSALPAGGGAVATVSGEGRSVRQFGEPHYRLQNIILTDPEGSDLPPGTKLYTTPQPSAAEDGGSPESAMQKVIDRVVDGVMGQREEVLRAFVAKYGFQPDEAVQVSGSDGSWRIIRRSNMYANQDAAVGAQGDGEDFHDRFYGMKFRLFLDPNGDGEGNQIELLCGMTAGADADETAYFHAMDESILQRVAAPAAGKGVDDAVTAIMRHPFADTTLGNIICAEISSERLRPQLAAALAPFLTRQPVAGDERVNVDHLRAIACEVENHRPQGHPSYGKYIVSEQFVRAAEKLAKMARNTAAPAATPTDGGEG